MKKRLFVCLLLLLSFNKYTQAGLLPEDQETCFAPDEPCAEKLMRFIKTAESSIDVAIFDINLEDIVGELIAKSKSIQVRVVVDKRQSAGEHSLVKKLIKAGVEVRFGHQRGIMHDKFTVVDNKMVETGSFNYTNHATLANQENQIYLANAGAVTRFKNRFESIWQDAKIESIQPVK